MGEFLEDDVKKESFDYGSNDNCYVNLREFEEFKRKLEEQERSQNISRKRIESMGETPIGMIERLLAVVDKFGIIKIIIVILIALFTYFSWQFLSAFNYEKMVKEFTEQEMVIHSQNEHIRMVNSEKIRTSMLKLQHKSNADRVSIIEMHNGKENPTGLPFRYCDMTYEIVCDTVPYVSDEYEDINMSKFTFPDYLYSQRYFIGTIQDLKKIDKKLASKLEINDVEYFGIMLVRNSQEIGFLMVSYESKPNLTVNEIGSMLSDHAQEIGYYLDLNEHVKHDNTKK